MLQEEITPCPGADLTPPQKPPRVGQGLAEPDEEGERMIALAMIVLSVQPVTFWRMGP